MLASHVCSALFVLCARAWFQSLHLYFIHLLLLLLLLLFYLLCYFCCFCYCICGSHVTLKMWPDGKANPIGTCVENLRSSKPVRITLGFHAYPQPIAFPKVEPVTVLPMLEVRSFVSPI